MESGIELKESEIPLTTGVQNPSSTDKYWNSVPGIRNPQCVESRIQECPWFAYMGWYVKLRSSFTFTIRNTHDCSKLFVPTKCTSVRTWKLPDGGKVKQQTKQTYLPLPHHLLYLKKRMQEVTNWELIQYYCRNWKFFLYNPVYIPALGDLLGHASFQIFPQGYFSQKCVVANVTRPYGVWA